MKLYQAGVPYHSRDDKARTWRTIEQGAGNFLFTFAHNRKDCAALLADMRIERVAGGVVLDLPRELWEAFVASGLPHTVAAFRDFLAARTG